MNASDAIILTSLWEGSPNVIKEAMACNVPIVSVDVGDVKQVLSGCEGCYLSAPGAKPLAHALEEVLSKDTRTTGRERIADLEIQKTAKRIIEIYRRLHHHHRRKQCGIITWKRPSSQTVL
jgi:glycosyltransferase involved in cell wall biosynthesis